MHTSQLLLIEDETTQEIIGATPKWIMHIYNGTLETMHRERELSPKNTS